MSKAKWIMKQYWRITAIRAWMGLALAMFSLGKVYADEVPSLAALGLLGAVILGGVLVLIFLGIGWLYDVKGRMWSPKMQALVERDPYRYIPNYKTYAIDYPALYAIILTLQDVLEARGLTSEPLNDVKAYMQRYFARRPEREDITGAEVDSEEFLAEYPFTGEPVQKKRVGLKGRGKLGFEVFKLRLEWIQDLTGLLQDALVFAAVYVVWIFPSVSVNGVVPVGYLILGFILLSIPMLFLITSVGWFYDKKLRVWSPDMIVKVERTPYTYVPYPRDYAMDFPAHFTILETMKALFEALNIDAEEIERILAYMNEYCDFKASRDEDMQKARDLRRQYGPVFEPQKVVDNEN